jgi:peptidoglycan/LPS O-acetylase OafA/YrhL
MMWRHLAVAVFIVVSGFPLALSPQRHGDRLPDGIVTYLRRRAFRIVPPYWVALFISILVIVLFTGAYTHQAVDLKSALVYGTLTQDVVEAPSPNGAFWPIAIEWQICFLFPIILLLWRFRPAVAVGLVTVLVVAVQLLGTHFAPLAPLLNLTPQFLALFTFGVLAAHVLVVKGWLGRLPWTAIGLALIAAAALGYAQWTPQRGNASFFWVGMVAGVAVAALFAGCAQRPSGRTARALGSRGPRWLGASSYSLYLIHLPVLGLVYYGVVVHLTSVNDSRFLLLLVLGPIAAVASSRLFWRVFERPFVEHRTLSGLYQALPGRAPKQIRVPARSSALVPPQTALEAE